MSDSWWPVRFLFVTVITADASLETARVKRAQEASNHVQESKTYIRLIAFATKDELFAIAAQQSLWWLVV
jgi:hypothetical protein